MKCNTCNHFLKDLDKKEFCEIYKVYLNGTKEFYKYERDCLSYDQCSCTFLNILKNKTIHYKTEYKYDI
jgi:hypothetical protein